MTETSKWEDIGGDHRCDPTRNRVKVRVEGKVREGARGEAAFKVLCLLGVKVSFLEKADVVFRDECTGSFPLTFRGRLGPLILGKETPLVLGGHRDGGRRDHFSGDPEVWAMNLVVLLNRGTD